MDEIRPERLVSLREARGFSQTKLADLLGVGQSSVARLEGGETRSTRNLIALAQALETTPEYLTGKTDDPAGRASVAERRSSYRAPQIERPDLVDLDEIDLRFGMGGTYGDGPVSVEKRSFSREWLRMVAPRSSPQYLFWATGDGDSMEPTIRSGEVILIDRSQDTVRTSDAIWAVAQGDIVMVKRVRPKPDGSVELLSDNGTEPIVTHDGETSIIGRVVAVVRRL